MTTRRISGQAAVDWIKIYERLRRESPGRYPEIRLRKHADPVEGPRDDLPLDAALSVLSEDPSLIYCDVPDARGYYADDGNQTEHYPDATSHVEAAEAYVSGGDWGRPEDVITVYVWRGHPRRVLGYDEQAVAVRGGLQP